MTALRTFAASAILRDISESAVLESAARHIPQIEMAMLRNIRDEPASVSQTMAVQMHI
ncbi:hypothetical protein C8R45DRAFT_1115533 [Mycena sanguinolenta]|nr:hypothetical protein C8R45DRAFT_1115533 [Mycena sanguinolenta]